jgi:hypothetical protein
MLLNLEAKKYEVQAASTIITFVPNFVSNCPASQVQRGAHAQHDDAISLLISLTNENKLINMLTTIIIYMFIFTRFNIYRQAHFTYSL